MKRKLGSPVIIFSLVDKIRYVLYNYPNGNVSKIYKDNTLVREYIYDQYDRLTWEKNYTANFEYSYVYDSNGNLTKKSRATKSSNNSTTSEITFMYGYNGDKMVSITTTFSDIPGVSSSQNFTYDALGNLTTYKGNTLEWKGHKLTKVGDTTMQYDYNGLRTRKGERYYYWLGNTLKMERWGENTIYYYYDESGVSGFRYNNTDYYYHKNIFGDVIAIYDKNKDLQATYEYDAWGNHKIYNQNGAEINKSTIHIGNINPIRYRGYYWDADFNLYYLQSRYYSPELCRFISPDDVSYLDPTSINGLNLYAYCNNDPVNYYDPTGHSAIVIGLIIGAIIGAGIGFGTVAYTDYQDDGQIFNGSVKWYEYVGGTVTGAVLGAGVGGIIGAGGAVLTSAMSSVTNKFISDLFAYTLTGTSFGTWEDYAVAFISGGLIKGLGMKGIVKTAYDVALRPAINQVVKIGTNRTETFNFEKYAYDVVTRGLTTSAPSPWKAFYRGGFRSMWDLYKRGYFA